MESGQLIMVTLVATIIYFGLFYYVIKSATEATTLKFESMRQSLLLQSIARQLGVSSNEIDSIDNTIKKMKLDKAMFVKQEPEKEVA